MMKKQIFIFLAIAIFFIQNVSSQTGSLSVRIKISEEIISDFNPKGRIYLFISKSRRDQPRFDTWAGSRNKIYAMNINNWKPGSEIILDESLEMIRTSDNPMDEIPEGDYRIQVLWDQDMKESGINAPGNLYSDSKAIELTGKVSTELTLNNIIAPQKLAVHKLLKEVDIKSNILSRWWKKEIRIKAAVLLPSGYYNEPGRKYPVRYNIAGYGGRYTRANRFVEWDKQFFTWWQSKDAPQIINVFLDGEGTYGDCYQMDSENSGPYGTALIEELIPFIEKKFRGQGNPESRFLDGCSTGGWVSLALQIFYPGYFNGCFSYSPDPVDFENFQLINIYSDENVFYNEYGYLRPVYRDITGEPISSHKDFIRFENVLGWNNTYTTSGGQFGSFNALFSPKGKDGLPKPLFDPYTGEIDHEVAEHWRKYDLKYYLENNWKKTGPSIQGKIWIWMGDMDNYYLNTALREFDEMLQNTENPKSDASINFSPVSGHCSAYSHKKVLLQIAEKIKQ
jgi:S-formylglutathione hydrolase FrmB